MEGPDQDADQMFDRLLKLSSGQKNEVLRYLGVSGWLRSALRRLPMDRRGRPLPWYTYGAIYILERRIKRDLSVFEFGSGQSTLWWASRVAHVTAVEHEPSWFEKMKPQIPDNVDYQLVELEEDGAYCRTAKRTERRFDVIVIDGRDRVNCSLHSSASLTERGIIIWDNSNRDRYQPGQDALVVDGFRRVDFAGHGPVNSYRWETAIFYKEGNWLGL